MRYLQLTEFELIPQDRLQKRAVFKLLAWIQGLPDIFKLHATAKLW